MTTDSLRAAAQQCLSALNNILDGSAICGGTFEVCECCDCGVMNDARAAHAALRAALAVPQEGEKPSTEAQEVVADLRLQAGIAAEMGAMGDAATMERAAAFIERGSVPPESAGEPDRTCLNCGWPESAHYRAGCNSFRGSSPQPGAGEAP